MCKRRDKAKRLMKHYFHVLAKTSSLLVYPAYDVELDELVDCLIDAAKDEIKWDAIHEWSKKCSEEARQNVEG